MRREPVDEGGDDQRGTRDLSVEEAVVLSFTHEGNVAVPVYDIVSHREVNR
jgi:hypothetical protein